MTSLAKIHIRLAAAVCLLAPLFCTAQEGITHNGPFFVSVEVPGSTGTYPVGINNSLTIAGYYKDASAHTHGFVRNLSGKIISFDVTDSIFTAPVGINDAGEIAGVYEDVLGEQRGFLRSSRGVITTFNPGGASGSTLPAAINASGTIVGMYTTTNTIPPGFAFLRDPKGGIVTFNIAGSSFVNPQSINASGEIAGEYLYDGNSQIGGFVRSADGEIKTFDYEEGIVPSGINDSGTLAGWYATTAFHGFTRSSQGQLTSFDPPGTLMTQNISINRTGAVTGSYSATSGVPGSAPSNHGFLRTGNGSILSFDPPGSIGTTPTSINDLGVVTGWYLGSTGQVMGFLGLP
jgi:hypothetical protein